MKITEEKIDNYQYFTTNGYDIWRLDPLRKIQMKNLVTGETTDLIVGQDSNFVPVRMPKIPEEKTSPGNKTKKQKAGGKKNNKPHSSKFKGVSRSSKPKADGSYPWKAQVWRPTGLKHLGTFTIEEEAAAAVAEYNGDMAEAQRLRELARQIRANMDEQAENNPDRPSTRRSRKHKVFECSHCKMTFHTRPVSCPNCRSASFDEVDDE